MEEAPGIKCVGQSFVALKSGNCGAAAFGDRAAVEIHGCAQAGGVHDFHGAGEVLDAVVDVLMEIDNAMLVTPLGGFAADIGNGGGIKAESQEEQGTRWNKDSRMHNQCGFCEHDGESFANLAREGKVVHLVWIRKLEACMFWQAYGIEWQSL
jgi:hypothetical protein